MSKGYPPAIDLSKVGSYHASAKSGAGYFYDEVLEYRVSVHPEAGGKRLHGDDDYFYAFASYAEALEFSQKTKGAELPLVLVIQKEHVNEPAPGVFEHAKDERIAEWQPDWLQGHKRTQDSIRKFLSGRTD